MTDVEPPMSAFAARCDDHGEVHVEREFIDHGHALIERRDEGLGAELIDIDHEIVTAIHVQPLATPIEGLHGVGTNELPCIHGYAIPPFGRLTDQRMANIATGANEVIGFKQILD